jgi:hypothetical protein
VECVYLAHDRGQWQAVVNMIMNLYMFDYLIDY